MADLRDFSTFLLIRHGAHMAGGNVLAGRSAEARLSPAGRAQAQSLARRISHLPVSAIYSSPVARTLETAAVLAEHNGRPVQKCEALSEINFGVWAGRGLGELRAQDHWQRWNEFRSGTRPPAGELMLEVQTRIVSEMLRLRDAHKGQYVALISHGDVIKAALAHFVGIPLDLFLRIEISLASVSAVALGDRGPWVLCINNTGEVVLLPE